MNQSASRTRELDLLARFLQSVHAATDLSGLAKTVSQFVQAAMPARSHDRRFAANFERSLEAALQRQAIEDIPIADHSAALLLAARQENTMPARAELEAVIETAAALLDATLDSAFDGTLLRASIDNIQEAARLWMARTTESVSLLACHELEALGAPPAMLISLQGKLLWSNGALKQLLNRHELAIASLEAPALDLVLPLLGTFWASGLDRLPQQEVVRPVPKLGLHLSAKLIHTGQAGFETFARVEVSQAKRRTALSVRERQIALLLASQLSYKAVAKQSTLSLDTVRTYVRRIYRKLAVNSRDALKQRLIHDQQLATNGRCDSTG